VVLYFVIFFPYGFTSVFFPTVHYNLKCYICLLYGSIKVNFQLPKYINTSLLFSSIPKISTMYLPIIMQCEV